MILVFYQYAYIDAVIVDIFNEYTYICIFKYNNRELYKIIKYANINFIYILGILTYINIFILIWLLVKPIDH